jgi:four helix bundle protein
MGRIQGDLKVRTFNVALSILELADLLPNDNKGWVVGKQLIRCGTSIGANVREADQAFSSTDFAFKCSLASKKLRKPMTGCN